METPTLKSPMTFAQQMEKLRSRGCAIADERECQKLLSHINYYRLSAYFLPFKQQDGNYKAGTTLDIVFRIYAFDREMRHLLFSAIEEIEVYLRTQIAYYHAHHYGPDGYLNAKIYNHRHDHGQFLAHIAKEKNANRRLPLVRHHNEKYLGKFPIWVIIELFTFGMLSYFYADMTTQDQKHIAREIFQSKDYQLRSWLRCCTDLRNICAHYDRLYFRKFTSRPALPKGIDIDKDRSASLFGAIFALKQLYPDKNRWNEELLPKIVSLVSQYNDVIQLRHIGFTPRWEQELCNQP